MVGGQPVNAQATFTTGAGTLMITLQNFQNNPTSVIQCVSAIGFTLSSGQTSGSLVSSSGLARTIASNGSYSDGGMVAAGWVLSGLTLDVLSGPGHAGPHHTAIGGPDGSNVYSNANNSITGNGPHNPFLAGPITFTLNIAGLTAASDVNSMFFQFGTADGTNRVPGVPPPSVPDSGTTVMLLGAAIAGLGLLRRKLS
jgi:hypothetical protein